MISEQQPETPSVSVIIATFNRAEWVRAAIDSALDQTVVPKEIIVVDDGSTDETEVVIDAYSGRIQAIHLENDGTGQTRPLNVGIRSASSDIILLLDSDDRLESSTIAAHLDSYSRCPGVGVVSSNWVDEFHTGSQVAERHFNQATMVRQNEHTKIGDDLFSISKTVGYRMLCEGNFLRSCTGLSFPRQVWDAVGGFDQTIRTSTDYNFLFLVLRHYDMAYIDRPLRILTKHSDNVSNASLQRRFRPGLYTDCIALLDREIASAPTPECTRLLKSNRSNWLLDLAFHYKEHGAYGRSLRTYLTGLRSPNHLFRIFGGIIKLPARMLIDLVSGSRVRSKVDS